MSSIEHLANQSGCTSIFPNKLKIAKVIRLYKKYDDIDHHGPSMYSGYYTASIHCCKRILYCNDSKITEFETIDTKNSSAAYVVMYKLIT